MQRYVMVPWPFMGRLLHFIEQRGRPTHPLIAAQYITTQPSKTSISPSHYLLYMAQMCQVIRQVIVG